MAVKRVFVCLFLLIPLCFSNPLPAQEGRGSGRLAGIVVDEAGNPLEGVTLSLKYLQFTNTKTTTSNQKGLWGFIGLGRGAAIITAEKPGYINSQITLEVSSISSNNPKQHIVMQKISSISTPDRIEISGDQLLQGNSLFDQRKYAEALALFQAFLEKNPKLYKVRLNVGNCLMELQEYEKAIAEYQLVLEGLNTEPADKKDNKLLAQVYSSIGDAYLRQNRFKEAEQFFKKSMEIDPSDHALAYNVAEILMNSNNTDEAIKYYELAIQIKPDWPKAYLKLGYAWLNKGNNQKAIEVLNQFIQVSPDDPEVPVVKEIIKKISKTK